MFIGYKEKENYFKIIGEFDGWESDTIWFSEYIDFAKQKGEPITIEIDSVGGVVSQGFDFFRIIKTSGLDVSIVTYGHICSIATIVALAGNSFAMSENAIWQFHAPSYEMANELDRSTLVNLIKSIDVSQNAMEAIYMENTTIPQDQLKIMLNQSLVLSADDCIRFNICDEIIRNNSLPMVAKCDPISLKKNPNLRKMGKENIEENIDENVEKFPVTNQEAATEEKKQRSSTLRGQITELEAKVEELKAEKKRDGEQMRAREKERAKAIQDLAAQFMDNKEVQAKALEAIVEGYDMEMFKDMLITVLADYMGRAEGQTDEYTETFAEKKAEVKPPKEPVKILPEAKAQMDEDAHLKAYAQIKSPFERAEYRKKYLLKK